MPKHAVQTPAVNQDTPTETAQPIRSRRSLRMAREAARAAKVGEQTDQTNNIAPEFEAQPTSTAVATGTNILEPTTDSPTVATIPQNLLVDTAPSLDLPQSEFHLNAVETEDSNQHTEPFEKPTAPQVEGAEKTPETSPLSHNNVSVTADTLLQQPVSPNIVEPDGSMSASSDTAIEPEPEPEPELTYPTLLFSSLSPLTPLTSDDRNPETPPLKVVNSAEVITEQKEVPIPLSRRAFTRATAILGAAGLMFTFALPGIQVLSASPENQLSASQQIIRTGQTQSEEESFDALNVVGVEVGDTAGSFYNYRDAVVQYPFADTVPLTDPFGEREYPVSGFHDAQDFAASAGTPVQAMADGIVLEAGITTDGCGFGLLLSHKIDGQEITSRYCHMQMDSHDLQVGDSISVGDPAGRVGNTGLSFGPHLHFVVTVDGEKIDPMPFLLQYNRETRPNR